MQSRSKSFDVAVIGGGVIGLSIAWRAVQRGMRVAVLERRRPGGATSWVAAGMLAPVSEAVFNERALLALGLASVRSYPRFVAELEEASGLQCGYLRCGTMLAARDPDEAAALERELAMRASLGLTVQRLRPSEARAREPSLAPTMRLALDIPDDHAIDPRRLTAALAEAFTRSGGSLRPGTEVTGLSIGDGRVDGLELGAELLRAEHVVVAAGPWSSRLGGIPEDARVPIHPVKGQILALRDPRGPGLVSRVLRMRGGYVVPRGDGRYVLGASVEERGFDSSVTAGVAFELLRDAIELLPGLGELAIDELTAGLRPATPDNLPAIGPGSISGLHWATGHYRHGVLLAPITAEIVVGDLVAGEQYVPDGEPVIDVGALAPGRFTTVPAGV